MVSVVLSPSSLSVSCWLSSSCLSLRPVCLCVLSVSASCLSLRPVCPSLFSSPVIFLSLHLTFITVPHLFRELFCRSTHAHLPPLTPLSFNEATLSGAADLKLSETMMFLLPQLINNCFYSSARPTGASARVQSFVDSDSMKDL